MELPFDPANPLLGIYLINPETPIRENICTPIFIVTLFTIAKIWKQPMCPSADGWIRKLWYIYTMEYYTTIKIYYYHLQQYDETGEHYAKRNKPVRER